MSDWGLNEYDFEPQRHSDAEMHRETFLRLTFDVSPLTGFEAQRHSDTEVHRETFLRLTFDVSRLRSHYSFPFLFVLWQNRSTGLGWPAQFNSSTYEGQVSKCLRKIAQMLPPFSQLFGKKAEVICIPQHFFKMF